MPLRLSEFFIWVSDNRTVFLEAVPFRVGFNLASWIFGVKVGRVRDILVARVVGGGKEISWLYRIPRPETSGGLEAAGEER